MIPDGAPDGAPREISLGWQQILAEVLGHEAGEDIQQAGQDASPGREKMQIPAPARVGKVKWNRKVE